MARGLAAVILLLGLGAMLALNLPGQMSMDSVSQLYQGRFGIYNSWHPPVMAWLLGVFDSMRRGTALFVIFDAVLLIGSWLFLLRLGRRPGLASVLVALVLVLTPQWLLYQGTVWKDILFADAGIGGFTALAMAAARWNAARGRWLILFIALLSLAAMTRQNGLLLLPIGALTLGLIAARQDRRGVFYGVGALVLMTILTVGGTAMLALHGDEGEGAEAELRVAQNYDLVGALHAAPGLRLDVLDTKDPALAALMRQPGAHLYSPLMNDTLAHSDALTEAITDAPDGLIFAQWLALVRQHPALYLAMRWPVFHWVVAAPDVAQCHPAFVGIEGAPDLLRTLGLTARIRAQDRMLGRYTRAFMGTPVLWHPAFLILALVLMVSLAGRGTGPDLAIAGLLAAALAFAASFFVVSIACDYRYLYFVDLAALTAAFHFACSSNNLPHAAKR